ncbi:uncharacterized protein CDAR_588481 [Caerostris darwini]|uniref:Uncharacterized protein n=1 Tax=Caerostris darwini TaxID=1538125 RepID=A0AAV4VIF0_9ARAC|nr:uncharacterized protein CDAR_588481 [Caerostris darwini]
MAEAKTEQIPDSSTLPDHDPTSGHKSKQHSPLRRGLTRMSKWVHAARRSLSSGEDPQMGHGISSPAVRRSDPPKNSTASAGAVFGPSMVELQEEVESLKKLVEEKDKIIADLRHEIQQLKVSCETLRHQINLTHEMLTFILVYFLI